MILQVISSFAYLFSQVRMTYAPAALFSLHLLVVNHHTPRFLYILQFYAEDYVFFY